MTDTLDRALDRLLHNSALRARWIAGEAVFDLDDDDREALRCVDGAQLDAMAALVRDEVWRRTHRGTGALGELFAETVAAWRAKAPDDARCERMVDRFVASEAFARHRALPYAGEGCSIEEAFFAWCTDEGIGDDAVREREFLSAMARALTMCPAPEFQVPAVFRRVARGWCAVSSGATPVLYAALDGRCVTGAVTPFVGALARGAERVEVIAERYGVEAEACEAVVRELRTLGLLDA